MEEKTLKILFQEALAQRGVSVGKLAELSKVPERYLEAFALGNFDDLPAAPYVRGYLAKSSAILGCNADELWSAYKKENINKISGGHDRLPANRFTLKRLNKSIVVWGILAIAILVYGGVRFSTIIGKPQLEVTSPLSAILIVYTPQINIEGKTGPDNKLTINSQDVIVNADGTFQTAWVLEPGINNIEIRTKKLLGGEASVLKKIIYEDQTQVPAGAVSSTEATASSSDDVAPNAI